MPYRKTVGIFLRELGLCEVHSELSRCINTRPEPSRVLEEIMRVLRPSITTLIASIEARITPYHEEGYNRRLVSKPGVRGMRSRNQSTFNCRALKYNRRILKRGPFRRWRSSHTFKPIPTISTILLAKTLTQGPVVHTPPLSRFAPS